MKVKKEYIVLFLIIVVLVLYISLRKENRVQYKLPEIAKLDLKAISAIELSGKDKHIIISKQGDKWVIGKEKYPAESSKIDSMLDFLVKPVLFTLVSDSKNYEQYGLDKDSAIFVKVMSGKSVLRNIAIGNQEEGQDYTFIKLENDYRVYDTQNRLRELFSLNLNDLRDKTVMNFKIKDITRVSLTRDNHEWTAVKTAIPPKKGKPKKSSGSEIVEYQWKGPEGNKLDNAPITGIISSLSDFQCTGYIYDMKKADLKNPVYVIKIKGKKEHSLSIFPKKKGATGYPAISSDSLSPFNLRSWQVNDIIEKFDKLSGKKKVKKSAP